MYSSAVDAVGCLLHQEQRMARNRKQPGRYKVYTRPELYEADRPAATWALRIGIVLTMLGIAAVFRQPLHEAVRGVFGS
jgi:hypothetical protein